MTNLKLSEWINKLAIEAGVEPDNDDLKGFLSGQALQIDLPESISEKFESWNTNKLTLESAKENPIVRDHFKAKYLSTVDRSNLRVLKELGVPADKIGELEKEADGSKKTQLQKELAEKQGRYNQLSEMVTADETAFKAADDKLRTEADSSSSMKRENYKGKTNEQYIHELDDAGRATELANLERVLPKKSRTDMRNIAKRVNNLEEVSQEDLAYYVRYMGDKIVKKGRKGFDPEKLDAVGAKWGEIKIALLDRIENSDMGKQLKEQYPTGWEKMKKFAGENKGWIMILLAILAAGVALPAVGAAGLAAGKNIVGG